MKKNPLIIVLLLYSVMTSGQITIGSNVEPKEGALLDLKESTDSPMKEKLINASKGVGLPRVYLEALDKLEPCASSESTSKVSHKGLIVYHVGSEFMPEGEYVWDGEKWNKKISVPNTHPQNGQFLRYNKATNSVEWATIVFPTTSKGDYYQYSSTVAVDLKGVDLPKRPYADANPYAEYELWDSNWKKLEGLSLNIKVPRGKNGATENVLNRLAIDFQTGVQSATSQGWISYAIGIFIKLEHESNYKLRLVRTETMGIANAYYPFGAYTLIGAINNLPPGNHSLIVAARRRNQEKNNKELAVGKKHSIASNTSNFQLQSVLRATLFLHED